MDRRCSLFINDMDEIRSLENPKKYYHAFTYKNERWNFRQRFHMNGQSVSQSVSQPAHSLFSGPWVLVSGISYPANSQRLCKKSCSNASKVKGWSRLFSLSAPPIGQRRTCPSSQPSI